MPVFGGRFPAQYTVGVSAIPSASANVLPAMDLMMEALTT
jgi:hypothetical protein